MATLYRTDIGNILFITYEFMLSMRDTTTQPWC